MFGGSNKEISFSVFMAIEIKAENNRVTMTLDNTDHRIEVRPDAYNIQDGKIHINADICKMIFKLSGNIRITEEAELMASVYCGKKRVRFRTGDCAEVMPHTVAENPVPFLTCSETWLFDTVKKLEQFTAYTDGNNMPMESICFNQKSGRVEALDGYRIAWRKMNRDNAENKIMLHSMAFPVLKKALGKNNETIVSVACSDKHVVVEGDDFTYTQRRVEGEYFRTEDMITNYPDNVRRLIVKTDDLKAVIKYAKDMTRESDKVPTLLYRKPDSECLSVYTKTAEYEIMEDIETIENEMSGAMISGYNPSFVFEALDILDDDKAEILIADSCRYPMYINTEEYGNLVLLVNITAKFGSMEEVYNNIIEKTTNKEVA